MSYENNAPYGYDPMTGEPLSAPRGQGSAAPYGYDPMTGEPLSAPRGQGNAAPYGYDPMTGEPLSAPQGQGNAAPYGYDPMTGEPRTAPQDAGQNRNPDGSYRSEPGGRQTSPEQNPGSDINVPGKNRLNPVILIAAAAVVVVLVVIFAVVRPFGGSTSIVDDKAVTRTFEAIMDSNDLTGFVQDASETDKGLTLSVSAEDLSVYLTSAGLDSDLVDILDPSGSLSITASKDMEASAELNVSLAGSDYEIDLYASTEELVAAAPGVLDDTYMLDLTSLSSDLQNSFLNPYVGSSYTLSSSDYEDFYAAAVALESVLSYMDTLDGDLLEDYFDALEDEGLMPKFKTKSGKVTSGGSEVSAKIHSVTMSPDEIYAFLTYTEDYLDSMISDSILGQMGMDASDYDIDELGYLAEEILESELYLDLEYDVKNNYMIRFSAKLYESPDSDEEYYGASSAELIVDFGQNPAKTEEITVTALMNEAYYEQIIIGLTTQSRLFTLTVSSAEGYVDDDGSYEEYDWEDLLEFSWDESSGDFELSFPQDDSVSYYGTAEVDGKTLTISDPGMRLNTYGVNTTLTDLTIAVTYDTAVEEPDEDAVNILELDDSEVSSIAAELTGLMSEYYYLMYY